MTLWATTHGAGGSRARHWVYGLGLTALGVVLVVVPRATRLRRSMRELGRIRTTYAVKLSMASNKDEVEERVREEEDILAELDGQLLTRDRLSGLTKAVNDAARATGCHVRSTRPSEPRILPRPAAKPGPKAAKGGAGKPLTEFLEWPVHVEVQGEFSQIRAMLTRVQSLQRHVHVTKLTLRPDGDDRRLLICDFELAGYGLRTRPQKG